MVASGGGNIIDNSLIIYTNSVLQYRVCISMIKMNYFQISNCPKDDDAHF